MALEIGRQGYLGLSIESTPGDAEAAVDTFIPFTDCTLEEKHEPLMDMSARASREANYDMVTGKKWGEGSVTMYLDATNIGYLLKLACGNEAKTSVNSGPPTVDDHLFYCTVSGNAPKTATLWLYRGSGVSVNQFTYSTVDSLEVSVGSDGLATATAHFITDNPTTVTAPSLTTTSGTLLSWQDMNVRFGDTPNAAASASAVEVSSFNFTLNNNAQAVFRSGSNTPSVIRLGELEVAGDYTLFLENDTYLDYYTGNTKKAMNVKLTGGGLGGGYSEHLELVFKRMALQDKSIDTGLSDYYAFTGNFTALHSVADPGFVDITLRNSKSTVYS